MTRLFPPALVLIAAVALAGVITGCKGPAADAGNGQAQAGRAIAVSVETITPQEFAETVQVTGSLASFDDVTVPAEEGGRLLQWVVPRGAHVAKGQVIARLDDALLKAAFEAANSQYQLAQLAYDKQQKVYEAQAISEFQIRSLEYQRNAAKAQADIARTRLEKMQVHSPIAGTVNMRYVDEGEMVGPGSPVAQIVATQRLKLTAGVPEKYASTFRIGDQVTFTVNAYPDEDFGARITFIGAAVSKDNRTLPIEATVTSGIGKLKPDMIAAMTIRLGARANAITVRTDFLQRVDRDRYIVYVAKGDVAEERPVTVGAVSAGRALITGGLAAGERLITLGFQNVSNGQRIVVSDGK
jgi:membrane fusion protein, multidrug efflux system